MVRILRYLCHPARLCRCLASSARNETDSTGMPISDARRFLCVELVACHVNIAGYSLVGGAVLHSGYGDKFAYAMDFPEGNGWAPGERQLLLGPIRTVPSSAPGEGKGRRYRMTPAVQEWRILVTYPRIDAAAVDTRRLVLCTAGGWPVLHDDGRHLRLAFTVTAPTIETAIDEGLQIARETWRQAFGAAMDPSQIRVLTAEAHQRELAGSDEPQLVDRSEVAEILRVSAQRVAEIVEDPGFPPPVGDPGPAAVYTRDGIIDFALRSAPAPGRRRRPSS